MSVLVAVLERVATNPTHRSAGALAGTRAGLRRRLVAACCDRAARLVRFARVVVARRTGLAFAAAARRPAHPRRSPAASSVCASARSADDASCQDGGGTQTDRSQQRMLTSGMREQVGRSREGAPDVSRDGFVIRLYSAVPAAYRPRRWNRSRLRAQFGVQSLKQKGNRRRAATMCATASRAPNDLWVVD